MVGTEKLRNDMVAEQIAARGVTDPRVLAAMREVPREQFVPAAWQEEAYDDRPIPIGEGQTISQPFIVAYMVEALKLEGGEKVLEIGAGSGYASAVLSRIARRVYAIERLGKLAQMAISNLESAGIENVRIRHADGTAGWPDEAPFDAILVSAGAPDVPQTLMYQLSIGGRMVVPVGEDPRAQELVRVTRCGENEFRKESLTDVRFVPLIGKEGWETGASE